MLVYLELLWNNRTRTVSTLLLLSARSGRLCACSTTVQTSHECRRPESGKDWDGSRADYDGTGILHLQNLHPGPDTPPAELQIYARKRAGIELKSPIGDQAVNGEIRFFLPLPAGLVAISTQDAMETALAILHHAWQQGIG